VVPESKHIFGLLREMQDAGTHVAMVIDEHGGTAGLATIEDIAEDLVGAITPAEGPPPIVALGPDHWTIDASLPVDELGDLIDAELPEGEWTSAAGLLMGVAGRVLEAGDVVDVAGRAMRVTQTRARRLIRIEIEPAGSGR
jgi:CBS domain containing-hemolysin-like protein